MKPVHPIRVLSWNVCQLSGSSLWPPQQLLVYQCFLHRKLLAVPKDLMSPQVNTSVSLPGRHPHGWHVRPPLPVPKSLHESGTISPGCQEGSRVSSPWSPSDSQALLSSQIHYNNTQPLTPQSQPQRWYSTGALSPCRGCVFGQDSQLHATPSDVGPGPLYHPNIYFIPPWNFRFPWPSSYFR